MLKYILGLSNILKMHAQQPFNPLVCDKLHEKYHGNCDHRLFLSTIHMCALPTFSTSSSKSLTYKKNVSFHSGFRVALITLLRALLWPTVSIAYGSEAPVTCKHSLHYMVVS